MHAVFTDGRAVVIWWNASATFRVYHYGRELTAFTTYGVESLAQAQAVAGDWFHGYGKDSIQDHLRNL